MRARRLLGISRAYWGAQAPDSEHDIWVLVAGLTRPSLKGSQVRGSGFR